MKTIFIQAILVLLLVANSTAIDTTSSKYLPLKVGNIWVYEFYQEIPPPNGTRYRFRSIADRDTLVNNHKYYFITNSKYISYYDTLNWFRIDSVSGDLLAFKQGINCRPGYEKLIDSLASDSSDFSQVCTSLQLRRRCYSTQILNIFNQQVESKVFNYEYIVSSDFKTYAKYFGIVRCYTAETVGFTITLLGCVLNGIKYGDTSITGIQPISSKIPEMFSLQQNYPNPFNPATKIKFEIPLLKGVDGESGQGVLVKVVIYDLLGREVATLVNEQLKPGTYEAQWDGSNYPSGLYFYKLIAGDFIETKKMVLIR